MSKVVIFGTGDIAQIAHFYLAHDSEHEVVAFTVNREYLSDRTFCGLPVVAFEEVEQHYTPGKYTMFIAVSYAKLNQVRTEKYEQAKAKGYSLISYISSRATHWGDTQIGDNCFIFEDNTIQPFVKIGNNVTLWSGNHIGHHAEIEDNCFITSHVVISGGVKVGKNTFIGVNSTLRDHITVGAYCVIGAGSLILKDTQESEVYTTPGAELSKVPSHRLRKL
ncbi:MULTISPECIES: acetyltransferase [unclassified Leptolyngbya]|uniref:acetyltransferase n=1 Tax=unclassified Leptolyngbya TaxID=2650499 RepID=UPI00168951DD|nr:MULTISPECIES: acetyltransferase [unclassified Leptolyngbya]MBD1912375.1 acetyltransferase [Leptolyngbya sp. FACHB-8]MBD2157989.1 acetyltransferase [Leptolyngbya sp. FACHB-16]